MLQISSICFLTSCPQEQVGSAGCRVALHGLDLLSQVVGKSSMYNIHCILCTVGIFACKFGFDKQAGTAGQPPRAVRYLHLHVLCTVWIFGCKLFDGSTSITREPSQCNLPSPPPPSPPPPPPAQMPPAAEMGDPPL